MAPSKRLLFVKQQRNIPCFSLPGKRKRPLWQRRADPSHLPVKSISFYTHHSGRHISPMCDHNTGVSPSRSRHRTLTPVSLVRVQLPQPNGSLAQVVRASEMSRYAPSAKLGRAFFLWPCRGTDPPRGSCSSCHYSERGRAVIAVIASLGLAAFYARN